MQVIKAVVGCPLVVLLGCGDAQQTPSGGSTSAGETSTAASSATDTGTASSPGSDASTGPGTGAASSTGAVECGDDGVVIPRGTAVTIDGEIDAGEWDDATPFAIVGGAGWEVTVGIKHDDSALLVVFEGIQPTPTPPFAFPELMLDVGNDKADALQPDDWWFHVSATDCNAAGELDNYRNCADEGTGWEANNFPGGGLIDVVEIRIEFATIGFDPAADSALGLLLRLSDTQGFAAHWPDDADPLAPATWSTIAVCPESA